MKLRLNNLYDNQVCAVIVIITNFCFQVSHIKHLTLLGLLLK
ncbi:Pneumovirus NS1 protein [Moritella viscosa]|uniref:Pneumovirus NS1 protein n=1 Tax=Moritella viscosa TaxID=80854 RepID=A0ABY1HJ66_9GAMM|nr:Pneumovirus NS1 protein [Moritella viscosa]SGZ02795.1 Pneumovirus NS1 protein [Moritella viscosa]SHO12495.1 Pneumovirus NS1 protein [Moritella viscosa]SHO16039.1 Pneumovirus NS1 protein [Moritella viscosa]SHO23078.1 Pneumovirus NS1 protein [Moritella viscosa]